MARLTAAMLLAGLAAVAMSTDIRVQYTYLTSNTCAGEPELINMQPSDSCVPATCGSYQEVDCEATVPETFPDLYYALYFFGPNVYDCTGPFTEARLYRDGTCFQSGDHYLRYDCTGTEATYIRCTGAGCTGECVEQSSSVINECAGSLVSCVGGPQHPVKRFYASADCSGSPTRLEFDATADCDEPVACAQEADGSYSATECSGYAPRPISGLDSYVVRTTFDDAVCGTSALYESVEWFQTEACLLEDTTYVKYTAMSNQFNRYECDNADCDVCVLSETVSTGCDGSNKVQYEIGAPSGHSIKRWWTEDYNCGTEPERWIFDTTDKCGAPDQNCVGGSGGSQWSSYRYGCVDSEHPPSPSDLTSTFLVATTYENNDCTGDVISFEANKHDSCQNVDSGTSDKVHYECDTNSLREYSCVVHCGSGQCTLSATHTPNQCVSGVKYTCVNAAPPTTPTPTSPHPTNGNGGPSNPSEQPGGDASALAASMGLIAAVGAAASAAALM